MYCLHQVVFVLYLASAYRGMWADNVVFAYLLSFERYKIEMEAVVNNVTYSMWIQMIVYCTVQVSDLHCCAGRNEKQSKVK